MRNIKLLLEYDGTQYHGFQRQPEFHGPTIQGTLEDRLSKITNQPVTLTMAGRTDAGVHALGQVVNFFSETKIPMDKLPKAVNSLLPYDIRVKYAAHVADDFNARFSAVWKRYCYTVYNYQVASVFNRLYAYHVPQTLNFEHMVEAARMMEGKRDFRAFCAAGSPVKNFVRTLMKCELTRDNEVIRIVCEADGFLYNMVRIISGTLLDVGKGRLAPGDIPGILESGDRATGGVTAPPQGLCLLHVQYD
ncbi:MAG TPA: tRNA pseudouridine(38-40) synthase TruA [Verrucomicrobiae bacterium]|nr:tRNA pseudouridine(38-40) synthase TruA [Verrucomicrobiae bacterium]